MKLLILSAAFFVATSSGLKTKHHGGYQYGPNPNFAGRGDNNCGPSNSASGSSGARPDNRNIDQLYRLALAEGGRLTVYAGGDTSDQHDDMKRAFETRFPNMTVEMIVDFSKFHDGRIDNQLATNTLIPDVAHLQTLQDFNRWKRQGVLMQYKPIGWDAVYPQFKDEDGYWTGIMVLAFSNNINRNLLPNRTSWPTEANDYLRPEFRGKIISTYPNDDDAVLFQYKQFIDKYGWKWLEKFIANEPRFVRNTQTPSDLVWAGQTPAVFTSAGALRPQFTSPVQFVLPTRDPFVSWAQRAAIFKATKNPNAAKLYLSWWLDLQTQRDDLYMWSVRKDVAVPTGYKSIFDYKGQSDPSDFARFMEDRAAVERFKTQVTLYVGEVQGISPPGNLGLHPTKQRTP